MEDKQRQLKNTFYKSLKNHDHWQNFFEIDNYFGAKIFATYIRFLYKRDNKLQLPDFSKGNQFNELYRFVQDNFGEELKVNPEILRKLIAIQLSKEGTNSQIAEFANYFVDLKIIYDENRIFEPQKRYIETFRDAMLNYSPTPEVTKTPEISKTENAPFTKNAPFVERKPEAQSGFPLQGDIKRESPSPSLTNSTSLPQRVLKFSENNGNENTRMLSQLSTNSRDQREQTPHEKTEGKDSKFKFPVRAATAVGGSVTGLIIYSLFS